MAESNANTGSKNNLIIVIILLLVILLCGMAFGFYYMYNSNTIANAGARVEESVVKLDEFILTLSDPYRTFVKLNISLAYNKKDKDVKKLIQDKMPIIRDSIITLVMSKRSDDFKVASGKDGVSEIKKEIKDILNKRLGSNVIIDVYIQDLIIQ